MENELSKNELKDLVKRSDQYTIGALMAICPSGETDMNFEIGRAHV